MSTVTPVTPVTPASGGKDDAARIRARTPGARPRRAKKITEAAPLTTPEEREFWGRQMQSFWNGLADARAYPRIPDEQVTAVGEPAALTAKKYLKDAQEEHPEYLLLFVLTPYLMGAIRVEWERWTARRPSGDSDGGRERGRLRPERQRQDEPRPEPTVTRPLTMPDN